MSKKQVIQGKILGNEKVVLDHYVMEVSVSLSPKEILPGQFFMVKTREGTTDPLLKIPLSVHDVEENKLSFLYRVVGQATELLRLKERGESIELLGPLGNGFDLELFLREESDRIIIVGGGCGIAPLYYLAKKIIELTDKEIMIYLGAVSSQSLPAINKFQSLNLTVHVATDDGSAGYLGNVIDLLNQDRDTWSSSSVMYASGPEGMLAGLKQCLQPYSISAQVSLEAYMACGIGVCLGCALNLSSGYQLCCKDGPVFDINNLK